jgi:predicted alpha/beta-hydrolase family hydrolase
MTPASLTVRLDGAEVTALVYGAAAAPPGAVILAHGAGADQRSPFMAEFARAMADRSITAVTFNFPYTEQKRKLPDRRPVLDGCYRAVIAAVTREVTKSRVPLFIGGKSMGGRIATHVAAADPALPIAGLLLLGYPLHPPGRLDQRRDAHLPDIHAPMLIVQGSRDAFGTPAELAPIAARMTPSPVVHAIEGGDHSFKVKGGAAAQRQTMAAIYDRAAEWITSIRS